MNTLKIMILSVICFSNIFVLKAQDLHSATISPQELSTWRTLDKGKSSIVDNEFIIEETAGSDGYFIISPESIDGDFTINYEVKAMSESSVLIILFSASDKGPSKELSLPPIETEGSEFWTWRTNLEHYNLTFNNKSHNNRPFFFKNETPNKRGFFQKTTDNIMETNTWSKVEIGKKENNLWFKLDNKIIFQQEDCNPLPNGHLMFRISGTTGENTILAKASIKNLVITYL